MSEMLHKIESWDDIKTGDVVVIKTTGQLEVEGWEHIVWGLIKNRAEKLSNAHRERNYYKGMEKDIGPERRVTVLDIGTQEAGITVAETPYKIAREAILGVVKEAA